MRPQGPGRTLPGLLFARLNVLRARKREDVHNGKKVLGVNAPADGTFCCRP
jgi:hypothetical protein